MADTNSSPHIVIVSSPGMGHITPMLELTKLLVINHNFTATIITFADLSCSLHPSISAIKLPLPLQDIPPNAHILARICLTMANSVSHLHKILVSLRRTARIAAIIFDLFGSDFLSMAKEMGIKSYIFITSNVFFLSFMLHLPNIEETSGGELRELPETLRLPGCVPLEKDDFLEGMEEEESGVFAWLVHLARHYDLCDGILVNSFEALEVDAAKFLKQRGDGKPSISFIGPIITSRSDMGSEEPSHYCMDWLDRQPSGSVVFVCFGSGGTLSWEQTRELALGLEMSGQRFLWVVRAPSDIELISSNFFNPNQINDDTMGFLPEGFMERTKERGMIVLSWAPQQEVLGHHAIGGFVSHCGWNSTLESMANGVPMVAWPLYAEQRMNAVLLVKGVKVGLRVKVRENGVVSRVDVANVVKELMEGEEGKEVQQRMQEMKKEAAKAMEKEGSSYKAMKEVANILKDLDVA